MISYKTFLKEAFYQPPRDQRKWLAIQLRKWQAYFAELGRATELRKSVSSDFRYNLDDMLHNVREQDPGYALDYARLHMGSSHTRDNLPSIIADLQELIRMYDKAAEGGNEGYEWAKLYHRSWDDLHRELVTLSQKEHVWAQINEILAAGENFNPGAYQEYPQEDVSFVSALLAVLKKTRPLFDELNFKLGEEFKVQSTKSYKKDKEDVEVLYHASLKAGELAERGFKPIDQAEGDRLGLGGAQTIGNDFKKRGISFTWDLYVAKEIMRSFKEAVLIAKGQVKVQQVKDWAEREGIWDRTWDYTSRDYSFKDDERDNRERWTGAPHQVFDLYKTYLTFSKKRYNPLYWGADKKFVDRLAEIDYSGIGVIQADISGLANLGQDSRELASMMEIRATLDQISNIKRVL